jgi:protein-S-isoprenylcysteine O-methyltransferase Ste14
MTSRLKGNLLVLIQFFLLIPIFVLPPQNQWQVPQGLVLLASIIQLAGFLTLVTGLLSLGRFLTAHPEPLADSTLKTGGIYSLVRHPIYSGILGLVCGQIISSSSVLVLGLGVGLLGVLMYKSRFEEQLLMKKFPEYATYAARVGRLVPFVGRVRPLQ